MKSFIFDHLFAPFDELHLAVLHAVFLAGFSCFTFAVFHLILHLENELLPVFQTSLHGYIAVLTLIRESEHRCRYFARAHTSTGESLHLLRETPFDFSVLP